MPRPNEFFGIIHEWLDGELDAAEAARVAKLVETDAEWDAAAAEARGLIAASSRIVGALDAVPGGVIPEGSKAAPSAAARRGFRVQRWMRIAAGLVLVAGTAYLAQRGREGPASLVVAPLVVDDRAATPPAVEAAEPPTPPATPPATGEITRPTDASPSAATASGFALRDTQPVTRRDAEQERGALAPLAASLTDSQASMQARARQELDSLAKARLGENLRLEQVVVTGAVEPARQSAAKAAASGAGAPSNRAAVPAAAPTAAPAPAAVSADQGVAQLRPRAVTDREGRAELGRSAYASILEGCWRTRTTAEVDSVLVNPRVVATIRDTLIVSIVPLSEGRRAVLFPESVKVVRRGADELRGTASGRDGEPVPFAATRISCP